MTGAWSAALGALAVTLAVTAAHADEAVGLVDPPVEVTAIEEPQTHVVEVTATVYGMGRTPEEAKREALQRARDKAVAEVAGIRIAAQQLRLKTEEANAVRDGFVSMTPLKLDLTDQDARRDRDAFGRDGLPGEPVFGEDGDRFVLRRDGTRGLTLHFDGPTRGTGRDGI